MRNFDTHRKRITCPIGLGILSLLWFVASAICIIDGVIIYNYLTDLRLIPPWPTLNFLFMLAIGLLCFSIGYGLWNLRYWVVKWSRNVILYFFPIVISAEILVFKATPFLLLTIFIIDIATILYIRRENIKTLLR